MMPITLEMNGLKTRATQHFAEWSDRLLYEQTNEIAAEDEATLRMG